jgi:hypothetical protein
MARFDRPGTYPITVRGRIEGVPATLPYTLDLPESAGASDALPLTWARAQIADRMTDRLDPRASPADLLRLQEEITVLGLEYHVVTPWTSFVAVAHDEPVQVARTTADLPVPPPAGVTLGSELVAFGGSSAPEPATWLGGLVVLALGAAAGRRRLRA